MSGDPQILNVEGPINRWEQIYVRGIGDPPPSALVIYDGECREIARVDQSGKVTLNMELAEYIAQKPADTTHHLSRAIALIIVEAAKRGAQHGQ